MVVVVRGRRRRRRTWRSDGRSCRVVLAMRRDAAASPSGNAILRLLRPCRALKADKTDGPATHRRRDRLWMRWEAGRQAARSTGPASGGGRRAAGVGWRGDGGQGSASDRGHARLHCTLYIHINMCPAVSWAAGRSGGLGIQKQAPRPTRRCVCGDQGQRTKGPCTISLWLLCFTDMSRAVSQSSASMRVERMLLPSSGPWPPHARTPRRAQGRGELGAPCTHGGH